MNKWFDTLVAGAMREPQYESGHIAATVQDELVTCAKNDSVGKARRIAETYAPHTIGEMAVAGKTLLSVATENDSPGMVKFLIEQCGADTAWRDKKGRTVLHTAIESKSVTVIRHLKRAISVNASDNDGRTPLHYATREKRTRSDRNDHQI